MKRKKKKKERENGCSPVCSVYCFEWLVLYSHIARLQAQIKGEIVSHAYFVGMFQAILAAKVFI